MKTQVQIKENVHIHESFLGASRPQKQLQEYRKHIYKKKAYIPLCFLSEATFQHIVMLLSVGEDLSSFRCEAEIKLPMNKSDSCRQLEKP